MYLTYYLSTVLSNVENIEDVRKYVNVAKYIIHVKSIYLILGYRTLNYQFCNRTSKIAKQKMLSFISLVLIGRHWVRTLILDNNLFIVLKSAETSVFPNVFIGVLCHVRLYCYRSVSSLYMNQVQYNVICILAEESAQKFIRIPMLYSRYVA